MIKAGIQKQQPGSGAPCSIYCASKDRLNSKNFIAHFSVANTINRSSTENTEVGTPQGILS